MINLNKHGIIEASAGTGKTYTIEHLVPRIIEEKIDNVSQIVVVTFTEKATGELKERLRANLENKLTTLTPGTTSYEKIKKSIEGFESITISTIHGFCYKLLSEYAFENRGGFSCSIVDDSSLLPALLANQMRSGWKKNYGNLLEMLLELSDFADNPRSFCETVTNLAVRYIPGYDSLFPAPRVKNAREALEADLEVFNDKVSRLIEALPDSGSEFITEGFHSSILKSIISPLYAFAESVNQGSPEESIIHFKAFYNRSSASASYNGSYDCLISKIKKKYQEDVLASRIHSVCALLDEVTALFIPLSRQLLVNTVHNLVLECQVYKKEHNLISYNDMLLLLNKALEDPFLLSCLQKRFRYAILDEFQDTDMIQWEIFRKIFVDIPDNTASDSQNRLFIVGDPKQSIYRFRGADINTYIEAKEYLLNHGAQLTELTTNYRSTGSLVDSLNTIFNSSGWNFGKGITYSTVQGPGEENSKTKAGTGLAVKTLNVVDMGDVASGKARALTSDFIVREISHLLQKSSHYDLRTKHDTASRPLTESDIAVITRSRKDALTVESLLRTHGIKCTIYKKEGLYQSPEALGIYYLLSGLSAPEETGAFKKSLLTDFFAMQLSDLAEFEKIDSEHPVRKTFLEWSALAARRDYSALFHALLNYPGLEEGLLRKQEEQQSDQERIITNYKHILENLEMHLLNNNLSIEEAAFYMQNLILGNISAGKDENLHRLETEEKRVQILTIHASKGLEFPIVFVYGGFSDSNKGEKYYNFHQDRGTIYDLSKIDESHKLQHEAENDAEEKRLYYVAFTRAMCALYIPYFTPLKGGKQAPLTSFIKEAVQEAGIKVRSAASFYDSYKKEQLFDTPGNQGGQPNPQQPENEKKKQQLLTLTECIQDSITGVIDQGYLKRAVRVTSFSALSAFDQAAGPVRTIFGDNEMSIQEMEEVTDESAGSVYENLTGIIPGGVNTGLMFHEVLEKINYSRARTQQQLLEYFLTPHQEAEDRSICQGVHSYCDTVIKENRKKGPDDKEKMLEQICHIIHKTLYTKLEGPADGSVVLAKVAKKLHEVEFFLDFSAICRQPGYRASGYLTGIIDLVFCHNNKYYIADWKTNTLGTYKGPQFEKSVFEHYKLQMDIYYLAFIKWLKFYIKDFDYERDFGGIFYLYLRGIPEGEGVFFKRPGLSYYEDTHSKSMRRSLIDKIEGLVR